MGPVAFEALDVGDTRELALGSAQVLRDAGIRFDLMSPTTNGGPYRLMIRSQELAKATLALADSALAEAAPSIASEPDAG